MSLAAPSVEAVPTYTDLLALEGRTFVVLGAGQGMGRQSAHALSQAGAQVVCVDREPELAQSVADEVGGHAMVADVTLGESVADLFAQAAEIGAIHGVVDVVGMADSRPIVDIDEAAWDDQFSIVLRHAFHAIRFATPHLQRAQGASMVFIGSMAGVVGIPHQAAYGAAKAALHHLVRTAALELGPTGVRLNAIAPGFVRTPRLVERLPEEAWRRIAAEIPTRRVATTTDIAAAVLFLISDMSRQITGQVLSIDGGTSTLVGMPPIEQLLRPEGQ